MATLCFSGTVSEDTEITKFAVALGMASFQAQSLEHSLVSLFAATFVLERGEWDMEVRTMMDTRYNQTLGKLVLDAAKELHLTAALTNELEDALKLRNWVIHHFFREYGAAGLSAPLMAEATQRLESIWPKFEKTADNIYQLTVERQVNSGRSKEQIHADIERALKVYLNERGHT